MISSKTRIYPIQLSSSYNGRYKRDIYRETYKELGLETIEKTKWCGKIWSFYNAYKIHSPKYLFNIIPVTVSRYNARNINNIPQFKVKHNFFQNSLFHSVVIEWNKFDLINCNSESFNVFKNSLLKFIPISGNSVFNCHKSKGVKLLTRLRPGLSYLRQHKFKHGFQNSPNRISNCSSDIKTLAHFLLHCRHYSNGRSIFLNTIRNINIHFFDNNDLKITEALLNGDSSLNDKNTTLIFNATIDFLFVTKKFDANLLQSKYGCFV